MRKYLLPQAGRFYKANLHMHSTISDGRMTVEWTKENYQKQGYSIVAYTDHDFFVPHHDLTDENFLALSGVELAFNDTTHNIGRSMKTYHINLLAKSPSITEYPPVKYAYTQEAVNRTIEDARKAGFLVTYNHPSWSLQNYDEYCDLKGVWGVEVFNHIGTMDGLDENDTAFEGLLRKGQRVVPLATDDAHWIPNCFGGWTMIKAEKLEYETITAAMERGDLYSSSGPEIKELYIEDGVVTIKTSPVKSIALVQERRHGKRHYAENDGYLTETQFDIREYLSENATPNKPYEPYIRLIVVDERGNRAWTRAYFEDEL